MSNRNRPTIPVELDAMDLGIINFALYIIREKGYYKDGEKAEYLAEVMEKIKIACQNVNDPQYYNQYRDDWYHP